SWVIRVDGIVNRVLRDYTWRMWLGVAVAIRAKLPTVVILVLQMVCRGRIACRVRQRSGEIGYSIHTMVLCFSKDAMALVIEHLQTVFLTKHLGHMVVRTHIIPLGMNQTVIIIVSITVVHWSAQYACTRTGTRGALNIKDVR